MLSESEKKGGIMDDETKGRGTAAEGPRADRFNEEELPGKMGLLYHEVNALKMASIRHVMRAEASDDPDRAVESLRHTNTAIRAVMIQLRILAEQARQNSGILKPPGADAIWEAMQSVPQLKALFERPVVRHRIMEKLKEMDKKEIMNDE